MSEEKTKRGRKLGVSSKKCLVRDELLHPYEIHIDESSHTYLLVDSVTGLNVAYYTTLPHVLKGILRHKLVPKEKVYTLKQYQEEMEMLNDRMMELLGMRLR
jgi:hypothetical protein